MLPLSKGQTIKNHNVMKRIISASYKDDTPAFQSEEFFENYAKGEVTLQSKFGQRKISLKPEDVYCFVFWTKNPSDHFVRNMNSLKSPFYFQWTITSYGPDIEPNVPDKREMIEKFKRVSEMIGARRVVWRYDPIFISTKYTIEWHKEEFRKMCESLEGYTNKCVISFMDEYGKIAELVRAGMMRAPTTDEIIGLASYIGRTAREHGITVQTCSEGQYGLTRFGIHEAPCVDAQFIEGEFGVMLPDEVKTPNSFRRCLCAVNTDIGAYHRCKHDCKYCYAK